MLSVIDELGIPGIIDVHSHFMPHQVMDKVWQVFDNAESVYGVAWPVSYRGSETERLEQLREFGVVAYTSLVYAHKAGMAQWLNDWCREFARQSPGCLQTATFFPEPQAAAYVDEAISAGVQVCKIHLQVGAFDPRDPFLDEVWDSLSAHQIPTVVHCGSGPLPGPFTGPGPMRDVLAVHPELPVIVAHLGAPEYEQFLLMSREFPNVYLDTTMAFTAFMNQLAPFPEALNQDLFDAGMRGRILFGSDFPNIPYDYEAAVGAVVHLGLGDEWTRRVLWANARDLFDVPVSGTSSQVS